jgi:hypothetical protein
MVDHNAGRRRRRRGGIGADDRRRQAGGKGGDEFRLRGLAGEVAGFLGVAGVIIEFAGPHRARRPLAPFGVAVGGGAGTVTHELRMTLIVGWPGKLAESGLFDRSGRIFQDRHQRLALQARHSRQAAGFHQRGIQIEQFDRCRRAAPACLHPRHRDQQWHAGVQIEVGGFRPQRVFSEVIAVIGPKDDDGFVAQAELVEAVENLADLGVEITGGGHVAVADFLDGIGAELPLFVPAEDLPRVMPADAVGANAGQPAGSGGGMFSR